MKVHLSATLALGLLVTCAFAQNQPDLTNPRQTMSYALGANIATKLKRDGVEVDMRALLAGMADMQAGKPGLTPEQQKAVLKDMKADIKARAAEKRKVAGVENLKIGQAFLAANAKKEGVKVIPVTAPDGSKAEVQCLVLKSGSGPSPIKTDVLKLHYEGSLIDGTVFDSSVQRGLPFIGHANDFIPGWTEPLQRMKVGDKWRLFIPPSLGYGEFVPYNIGPYSTLIYDIELLGIEPPSGANPASVTGAPVAPVK
jgi:FKBP-type peptidyl-prolyl cis-trans isomerase FklB